MSVPRGLFIVLEGVDRVGKSTQCAQLVKQLNNHGTPAELVRFPDRSTRIGQLINEYLQAPPPPVTDDQSAASAVCESANDRLIHLLFSANRWEKVAFIERRLTAGVSLVCDRYAYSGVAYSAAKPGLTLDWCCQSDAGLPRPDLVLLLTLAPEAAQRRAGFGAERYERRDFQSRVSANYERLYDASHWHGVDADGSEEQVTERVWQLVQQCVVRRQQLPPLGQLWNCDAKQSGGV